MVDISNWYAAHDLRGSMHPCFKDNAFNVFSSPDDVRAAIDQHMKDWRIEYEQYVICKVTHLVATDDTGMFIMEEQITQTIEVYPLKDSNCDHMKSMKNEMEVSIG